MKKKVATIATAAVLTSTFSTTAFADNTYTVQKGDTLSHIARKHNTSVSQLKKLNSLTSDRIYINQQITVTSSTATSTNKAPTTNAPTPPKAATTSYTVVSGDTLIKIANQHNISLGELQSWNNISSHLIYPGQVLTVSKSTGNNAVQPTPVPAPEVAPSPNQYKKEYVVVVGDYLGKIAQKFNVKIAQLMEWNNLTSTVIYPGQVIKVKAPSTTPVVVEPAPSPVPVTPPAVEKPAASVEAAPPVAKPAVPVTPPSNTGDATTVQHVIKMGDTLRKIADEYGLTVEQLKQLNGLKSDLIFAGQTLKVTGKIPGTSGSSPDTAPVETKSVVNIAKQFVGTPYVWGGSTAAGFDCSGFIYYVFNKVNPSMKRYSSEGYFDRSFYVDSPQVGDLVFFKNTYKSGISHLGIYVGNNEFIHADSDGVRVTSLNNVYWKQHFDSFKRFY